MVEHVAPRDTPTADGAHYRYRAHPPLTWIVAAIAVTVPAIAFGGAFGPHRYWLLLWLGVCAALAIGVERRFARWVTLTPDLRLSVRGSGQDIDVDVRQLKEIRISPVARLAGWSARVHYADRWFRLWSDVQYVSGPADHTGLRPERWSGQGFRDLVYRLSIANPDLVVRGVRPPSWARRAPRF
ncbi:MAG TPA: hypothetical protein VIL71_04775 [Spirillospora sp.]